MTGEFLMQQALLIADGDAELCNLYRCFLAERGYAVETSSDALDCLSKLREWRPAALVLDMEIPQGGDDCVLAWLRKENPAHEIPVILTATAGRPSYLAEFIDPPAVAYLPKPFTLTALLERVRSALAKKAQREPSPRARVYTELFIG
jgi:DNA-binding NtrC family response regulator